MNRIEDARTRVGCSSWSARLLHLAGSGLLAAGLGGCPDGDGPGARPDASDTSVGPDAIGDDASSDTSTGQDALPTDTAAPDAFSTDAANPDTLTTDTSDQETVSQDTGGPDTAVMDTGGTDVAPSDVDAAGDASVDPGTPILERPMQQTHTCTETLPPTQPDPGDWTPGGLALDSEGAAWVARAGVTLGVSTIGVDGTLGPLVGLDADQFTVGRTEMVVQGGRVIIVWGKSLPNGDSTLSFAAVEDGSVVVQAKNIVGTTSYFIHSVSLAPAPNGEVAVLWADSSVQGELQMRFARIDGQGNLTGDPIEIGNVGSITGSSEGVLVTTPTGYAVAWTATVGSGLSEVWFATMDGDGKFLLAPKRISQEAGQGYRASIGYRRGSTPLLVEGDGYLLAYSLSYFNEDYANPKGWATVELAAIDSDGSTVAHRLHAPVNDVFSSYPTLFRLDGTLGLLWSSGTAIYVCAGCFVDNDLKMVLLDPDALVPASEVATHTHAQHGYVQPATVVLGQDVLTVASQDFHALSYPAAAAMHCAPAL